MPELICMYLIYGNWLALILELWHLQNKLLFLNFPEAKWVTYFIRKTNVA